MLGVSLRTLSVLVLVPAVLLGLVQLGQVGQVDVCKLLNLSTILVTPSNVSVAPSDVK